MGPVAEGVCGGEAAELFAFHDVGPVGEDPATASCLSRCASMSASWSSRGSFRRR